MKIALFLSLSFLSALLSACTEGESPKRFEEPTQSALDRAMEKASEGAEKLKEAAAEMAAAAQEQGRELAAAAQEQGRELAAAAQEQGRALAAAAAAKTEALSAALSEKTQAWLSQAEIYIREGKTELAQSLVEQLQQVRGSLPESMQSQVDQLQALLAEPSPGPEETGGAASADAVAAQAPEAASEVKRAPSPADETRPGTPEPEAAESAVPPVDAPVIPTGQLPPEIRDLSEKSIPAEQLPPAIRAMPETLEPVDQPTRAQ